MPYAFVIQRRNWRKNKYKEDLFMIISAEHIEQPYDGEYFEKIYLIVFGIRKIGYG